MRAGRLGGVTVIVLAAIAAFAAFVYQPLVSGPTSGHDEQLLIDVQSPSPETGNDLTVIRYRFHADTSYYTLFSLRNQGALAVRILGLDPNGVLGLIPSIEPAELLFANPADDPHATVGWQSAAPFTDAVVEPNAELALWIRWQIGACDPSTPSPYAQDSGIARSSIPLQWSILGITRSTTIDLGYSVEFHVTPEDFATQCEPAVVP